MHDRGETRLLRRARLRLSVLDAATLLAHGVLHQVPTYALCMAASTHIYIYTYTYVYICVHTCAYMRFCITARIYVYIIYIYTYTLVYVSAV